MLDTSILDPMYILLFACVAVVTLYIIGNVHASRSCKAEEVKNWNNGHCVCGTSWMLFSDNKVESLGRGYVCVDCGTTCWVKYSAVDNP
jgi:hypothetical protein